MKTEEIAAMLPEMFAHMAHVQAAGAIAAHVAAALVHVHAQSGVPIVGKDFTVTVAVVVKAALDGMVSAVEAGNMPEGTVMQ